MHLDTGVFGVGSCNVSSVPAGGAHVCGLWAACRFGEDIDGARRYARAFSRPPVTRRDRPSSRAEPLSGRGALTPHRSHVHRRERLSLSYTAAPGCFDEETFHHAVASFMDKGRDPVAARCRPIARPAARASTAGPLARLQAPKPRPAAPFSASAPSPRQAAASEWAPVVGACSRRRSAVAGAPGPSPSSRRLPAASRLAWAPRPSRPRRPVVVVAAALPRRPVRAVGPSGAECMEGT
jgi:hypothetical protein